jgi:hypothetical protein
MSKLWRVSPNTLREVMDDAVPEWPEEHQCRRCGAVVWRVMREDGEDVELDTTPIETHLILGKVRVRDEGYYRVDNEHPLAWKRAQCWRLDDPQYVHASEWIVDRELGDSWMWFASRVPLTVDDPGLIFSEHYHLCGAVSERSARSSLTSSTCGKRGAMVYTRAHDKALFKQAKTLAAVLSNDPTAQRLMASFTPQQRLPFVRLVNVDDRDVEERDVRSAAASPSESQASSARSSHPTADQLALF